MTGTDALLSARFLAGTNILWANDFDAEGSMESALVRGIAFFSGSIDARR